PLKRPGCHLLGCPCQKEPSTNTASFQRVNAMSMRPPGPRQWQRQPRTRARQSPRRSSNSGLVSLPRIDAMIRRRPSLDAGGERSVSELAAISLFSGAGGLDLGVERAGYRVLAALEYDADAAATLRANFTHTEILERDIRTVATKELLKAAGLRAGEADLLIGGPPCTPFSKSGNWLEYKRTGKDANADLLDHYLRILSESRPRAF